MPVDENKLTSLYEWLVDGARSSANIRTTIAELCNRLRDAGVPVSRFVLLNFQLHPNLLGTRFRWFEDGTIDQTNADLGLFKGADFLDNPMGQILKTRKELRRKLCDPDCPCDYQVLEALKTDGVTDYLAQPLFFSNNEVHGVTWATHEEGGFDDAQIAAITRIRSPFARLAETYILRLNASNLLSAYVGHDIGHKILAGQVKRGDVEEISACVLFADLVGFTALSNRQPAGEVLERLNAFYDCLVPPVMAHGGEVLKFMGDGILAIFPIEGTRTKDEITACKQALSALREAWGNGERPDFGANRPPFRAAVHVGKVQYGNIGSSNRLDFTAIGPTVNLAARLLDAAKQVDGQTVVSAEVATLMELDPARARRVSLRGYDGMQAIHTITRLEPV